MKALFIISSSHEQSLPPMKATDALGLQYTDTNGVLCGGYWIVGEAPLPNTVIVCIDSTPEMMNEMAANPEYLYLGDVIEPEITNA